MQVLIVEKSSAEQAATAKRFESIDRIDKDILDLSLGLGDEMNIFDRLDSCDVLIIGTSLAEQGMSLTERVKGIYPEVEILVMLPRNVCLEGGFRNALARGARKVIYEDAPALDLVQELMSIHEGFKARGKVREGRVLAVVQAKGGLGATSTCAALAEVCATHDKSTLLWDLDIETRDLCRTAVVQGQYASVVRQMFTGEIEFSRENLRKAVIPVSKHVAVLPPPDLMAASLDFVGAVEAIDMAQAVVALARHMYDAVIIDIGSRFSPAAGAIMQAADSVIVMVDDSILGISAARFFAPILESVVRSPHAIQFLCSGISISKDELARHVQQEDFAAGSWSLPVIPFDPAASAWPGSGKTLYALGRRQTKRAFEDLACALDLIKRSSVTGSPAKQRGTAIASCAYGVSQAAIALGLSYPLRAFLQRFVNP